MPQLTEDLLKFKYSEAIPKLLIQTRTYSTNLGSKLIAITETIEPMG